MARRMRQHALDNFKRLDVDVRNDTPVVEVRGWGSCIGITSGVAAR